MGLLFAQTADEWRQVGLDHIAAGRLPQATAPLEKACAMERPPGEACYYLARNYYALAEYAAARTAFDRILAVAPSGRVYRAAGMNAAALGLDEEAEADYRSAVKSGYAEARIDLGAFLFRQGRMAEAETLLEAAVKADPASARANFESGRVLLQAGKLTEAAGRLEAAVRAKPTDWNAHLLLGRAYQRLGRDAEAERELRLGAKQWQGKGSRPR